MKSGLQAAEKQHAREAKAPPRETPEAQPESQPAAGLPRFLGAGAGTGSPADGPGAPLDRGQRRALEREADQVADTLAGGVPPAGLPLTQVRPTPSRNRTPLTAPDAGSPFPRALTRKLETALGPLPPLRLHTSPQARSQADALGARAFTRGHDIWLGSGASPGDSRLLAHEAAHAAQQAHGGVNPASAPLQMEEAGARQPQSFAFGEDEMESRLESTPGGGRSEEVELQPGTEAALEETAEGGDEAAARGAAEAAAGEGEAGAAEAAGAAAGREGGRRTRARRAAPAAAAAPPAAGGAAVDYQSLVDADVAAYLNENVDPERLATLTESTQPLLEAAAALGEQQVVEPEASFLGSITGVSPLIDAFSRGSRGYEHEEPWLQTVAQVREVTSALGGVVGMIGLVATISGAILSLLVPPVGAFLLTVGRFCDIAALVLDAVSFALNIFLTSYNLYRLKNATDPEEKRRLLALVRSDAMQTVMSGIAVATAVAPGAARALGGTRLGRAASGAARRVAEPLGRLAGRAGRRVRGVIAATSRGRRLMRGAARVGAGARSLRSSAARAAQSGLVRLRGTAPVRWANRAASRLEGRIAARFDRLAAGRGRVAGFYRRRIRGFHERNRRLAEMINEPIDRAYYLQRGNRMRNRLAQLQTDPNLANVRATLEREFGMEHTRPAMLPSGRPARTVSGAPIQTGDFSVAGGPGSYRFNRVDADVLESVRQREFAEIQNIRATYPRATDAELARMVNDSPFIRGRWTEDELRALRQIHPGTDVTVTRGGRTIPGAVPKTPHHTIPAQMAPEIHRDPRFMQVANDPRVASYQDFLRRAYPDTGPNAIPRLTTLADAEAAVRAGNVAGVTDPSFLRGNQLVDELRSQGSTGLWVNPRDPTGQQRFLLNPHLVIGHNWDTRLEMDRAIFDMAGRLGLRGEVGRRLGRQATRQAGRTVPRYLAGGGRPAPARGGAVDDFLASLERRLGLPAITPAGGASGTARAAPPRAAGALPEAPADTGAAPAAEADLGAAVPQTPPSPTAYSPDSLTAIAEQREAVAAAIETVQSYRDAAAQAASDNEAARDGAEALNAQNETRAEKIGGEKADVAEQQGKIEQAGGAQEEMSAEGERAAAESERGKGEGDSVQAEGDSVSVEPKAEEPESKSWLERAWDATAGALWEELIRPAVNLVRRKVNQVMQAIGEFISDMINQALGLDEIEAEIDAGGEDITGREESLGETETGLGEADDTTREAIADNESTIEQAEANVADAQATGEEAATLLEALQAQDEALAAEQEAGRAYVQDFGGQHAEYFAQMREAAAGGSEAAPPESAAAPAEPAAESSAEGAEAEETLDAARLAPLDSMLAAIRAGELRSAAEVRAVVAEAAALSPDAAPDCRAAAAAFASGHEQRVARLERLAGAARALVGEQAEQAYSQIEEFTDEAAALAEELETARSSTLEEIGSALGMASAGEDDEGDGEEEGGEAPAAPGAGAEAYAEEGVP